MPETLSDSLALIRRHVDRATAALAEDSPASPITRAVLAEFARKLDKATTGLAGASDQATRELIVELEQAGDSAKVAADADAPASANSKKLVEIAHNSICVLKHETVTSAH